MHSSGRPPRILFEPLLYDLFVVPLLLPPASLECRFATAAYFTLTCVYRRQASVSHHPSIHASKTILNQTEPTHTTYRHRVCRAAAHRAVVGHLVHLVQRAGKGQRRARGHARVHARLDGEGAPHRLINDCGLGPLIFVGPTEAQVTSVAPALPSLTTGGAASPVAGPIT
jgi:hypothetical protein